MVNEVIVLPVKEELEGVLDEMVREGPIHESVVSLQYFLPQNGSVVISDIIMRVAHQLQELHGSAVLHLWAFDLI